MDRSFNCLLLNTETINAISIFKEPYDERKFIKLYDEKIHTEDLPVTLFKNVVKKIFEIQNCEMKFWKVNVPVEDIQNISTDDIVKRGIEMKPLDMFGDHFREELYDPNFKQNSKGKIQIIAKHSGIADFPNKKVKREEEEEEAKKIWVCYERRIVAFRQEDLEIKGIRDIEDLRREVKVNFGTLSNYTYDMIDLRKKYETEILNPKTLINGFYNTELEVIVYKENDDEGTLSGKSEDKNENNMESKRIKDAFQTEYQGKSMEKFHDRLKKFHEVWVSDKSYAPYLAIIQSSGSGKTRLVAELRTKGIYVLYICKRSVGSSGYPKSTPYVERVLDTIRDNKFKFLLCAAIEEIKNKGWDAEQFWNIQIRGDSECEEFWSVVLGSLVTCDFSLSKYNNKNFVKELFPDPEVAIPVVCCIDEAHELITHRNSVESDESHFVQWRRQIRDILWKGFFNVLLSTNGKIGNFLPSTMKDTFSARKLGLRIFPAYLDVSTTDVLASLAEKVGEDYDFKRVAYLGTPLWGSLAKAGGEVDELIQLACKKIRNFSDEKDDYIANLACISCTMALEVSPRIAEVDNLIASHMATAIGISSDRTSILCTYPSDAILASGALKGIIEYSGWESCLDTLVELFSRGVVEAGERGELVNRIIFSMRYANVAKDLFGSSVTYLEKIPLKLFLEKMNDWDVLLSELGIQDAEVGFNHWITLLTTTADYVKKYKGNKFLTKDLIKEAYHRNAAIKMPFGYENIDHIIPFKYSSGYGVISIQNKNAIKSTYTTNDNFSLINPTSVFGKRGHEGYKILGIYIDFHQGETTEEATSALKSIDYKQTRSSEGEPVKKATIMYFRGVETFEFGDEINKRLSKVLYTRPWPLDKYWSTFANIELDRVDAIRSSLPIIFEQEEGQSLINKWEMCNES